MQRPPDSKAMIEDTLAAAGTNKQGCVLAGLTTGDYCFAVCQSTWQSPICTRQRLCRVPHTAKTTRHSDVGKGVVCRVPFIGHTAKPLPCAKVDPRQKKAENLGSDVAASSAVCL